MQKKLIALAIAGLSGAAFAQSNVTIYGVADVSFEMLSGSGGNGTAVAATSTNSIASHNRVATNASYFGLKGSEDVGGGMKAVFQIENEFDFGGTTGNSRQSGLANRDSYVGLAGGFGTVVAGWLSSPHRSTGAKFDLMPGAAGAGSSLNIIGRVNTGSAYNGIAAAGTTAHTFGTTTYGGVALANNIGVIGRHAAIAYITPTFNGLSGVVAYVANETKDQVNYAGANNAQRDPRAWNLAANYENGPLALTYSYLTIKDFGALPAASAGAIAAGVLDLSGAESHKAHLIGAKYTFGNTTLSGMYDKVDASLADGAGAATGDVTIKRTSWYFAAKQTMGASDLTFAFAKAGKNSVGLGSRAVAGTDYESGSDAKMYSFRYAYNLSKRTSAYAQYSMINNGSNATYDFGVGGNNVAGTGNAATTGVNFAGTDPKVFAVGVRSNF